MEFYPVHVFLYFRKLLRVKNEDPTKYRPEIMTLFVVPVSGLVALGELEWNYASTHFSICNVIVIMFLSILEMSIP